MISVTFTSDVENIVATEHLYQWDNGQKLKISGTGTNADIHFANKKSEKALVVTPTITSGAMVAFIPNSLLTEPYPIIAYVYVPSDNGSKTIKSVTINVEARKQPSDFVLTEDEGVTTLETISQRANEMIQNATNQVNTAVSNMQTDYTNFKNTIQGELDDMKANTTIPNADTVDGKHASDFALAEDKYYLSTFNSSGEKYVNKHRIIAKHNVKNDGRFYLQDEDTHNVRVNYADGADTAKTANTAGTLATTPTNVCLRNISFGTADPQITDSSAEGYVAPGALYGQYEEVT